MTRASAWGSRSRSRPESARTPLAGRSAMASRSNRTTCWLPATTRGLIVVARPRAPTTAPPPLPPHQGELGPEGPPVRGHVRRPPEPDALGADLNHRDGRLGGDPGDRSPD